MGTLRDELRRRLAGKDLTMADLEGRAVNTGRTASGLVTVRYGSIEHKVRASVEPLVKLSVAELRQACEEAPADERELALAKLLSVDYLPDPVEVCILKDDLRRLLGESPAVLVPGGVPVSNDDEPE